MLTAILPINIGQSTFWTSEQGEKCLDRFMQTCRQVDEIQRYVVLSQNDAVVNLADRWGMEIGSVRPIDHLNRPYVFEEILSLARNWREVSEVFNEVLMILDHRNLLLTADDLIQASALFGQYPERGMVSLSLCRDYPCQFKSFYNFLECVVIPFDQDEGSNDGSIEDLDGFCREICHQIKDFGAIKINLYADRLCCHFSFRLQNEVSKEVVAQIIPYDRMRPMYERSREIHIQSPDYEIQFRQSTATLAGLIFILSSPAHSGSYDTTEIFTPPKATWQLGGAGRDVVSVFDHEVMNGRQQFPPIYGYDGSICVLGESQLAIDSLPDPKALLLPDACIVIDWVDYFHAVALKTGSKKSDNRVPIC